jgi:hypothetical protein
VTQDFRAGLDLAQLGDFSALIICERTGSGRDSEFLVRYARRWRGTSYPVLVTEVGKILSRLGKDCRIRFAIDRTGVGVAIWDLFKEAHAAGELVVYPKAITITSGSEPSKDGATVPKQDLVARLETLLAAGRLKVAPGLKLAPAIRQELSAFRAKVNANGHHAYEAGGGVHDDLVLALALAVWGADDSPPEAMENLTRLNRELRQPRDYDRIGIAERWRIISSPVDNR